MGYKAQRKGLILARWQQRLLLDPLRRGGAAGSAAPPALASLSEGDGDIDPLWDELPSVNTSVFRAATGVVPEGAGSIC